MFIANFKNPEIETSKVKLESVNEKKQIGLNPLPRLLEYSPPKFFMPINLTKVINVNDGNLDNTTAKPASPVNQRVQIISDPPTKNKATLNYPILSDREIMSEAANSFMS